MTYRTIGLTGFLAASGLAALVVGTGGERAPDETHPIAAASSSRRPGPPARVAGARTFYVDPGGSDRAPGSRQRPWRTVARVNRAGLRDGDRVLFRGGATFGDDELMPGASGTPGRPITFGAFGDGEAKLPRAVWFRDRDHLAFDRLAVRGPGGHGIQGSGSHISVTRSRFENVRLGVLAFGSQWRIAGNVVSRTGDSGMYLDGDRFDVSDNTIDDTGIDMSIDFAKHGIYLKVTNATIRGNRIRRFEANGVSVRYRNSVVEDNEIGDGPIAIAWFQYDEQGGTSHWRRNRIRGTTDAGIFVSRGDRAGKTRESFVIADNEIEAARGPHLLLSPTLGSFSLGDNRATNGGSLSCTAPQSEQTSC